MIEIIQVVLAVVIAVLALGVTGWAQAARGPAWRHGRARPAPSQPASHPAPLPRTRRAAERQPEPQSWPST
jgi:hypothetical protein